MTYGWAILVIAVALAVLFALGVFSIGSPQTGCTANPGFLCSNPILSANGLYYAEVGYAATSITITGTACSNSAAEPQQNNFSRTDVQLVAGQEVQMAFDCPLTSNTIGTSFSGTLWIQYNDQNVQSLSEIATVSAHAVNLGVPTTVTTSALTTSVSSTSTSSTSTSSTSTPSSSATTTSGPSTSLSTSTTLTTATTTASTTSMSTVTSTTSTTTSATTSTTATTTIFDTSAYYSYNDVLLVCNNANTESLDVCSYFSNARQSEGFNTSHIVYLSNIPASESVNDIVTQTLLGDVRTAINTIGPGKINYIVTTVGVPLIDTVSYSCSYCSDYSIDALMADNLTDANEASNPYYYGSSGISNSLVESRAFSWSAYHMYEVTRLDGPTLQSIYNLVKNAYNASDAYSSGYVLLNNYSTSSTYQSYSYLFTDAESALNTMNVNNQLVGSSFITGVSGLSGYASWGSNCGCTAGENSSKWDLGFVTGAIGETFVSTGARTMLTYPWTSGQSLISDLVVDGITGISGYVSEPYIGTTETLSVLFPYYFSGGTLADSYYSAMPELAWKSVIIGDPKAHVTIV